MLNKKEAIQLQKKIRTEPVFFAEKILKRSLWSKEAEIMEAVRDNSEVAVRSCHASGKTYTCAGIVHWWLFSYDDAVVITTAPTFRQVKEVLWREIRASAVQGLYDKNSILDTAINISDKRFALGLSTDKPGQFQGFHSPHLMVLIDEASDINPEIEEAIDGLTPIKIVRIGNPLTNSGRFAESFRSKNVAKMQISAFDTPNFQGKGELIPGLITPEYEQRMVEVYGKDSNVYKVRVLGEFPSSDPDTIFGVDDVSKAIDREAEVMKQWENKMGVDPARFGDDRTAIIIRKMYKVIYKETYNGVDLMQTTGKIIRIAKEQNVLPQNIYIDGIGVGAGIIDRLNEQGWKVNNVQVGEKAKDPEHYQNLRAELYDNYMREWLKKADIPKDDDFYELANIKYKFNSVGQMALEKKEDMKKRGLDSPDVADALAITFAPKGRFSTPVQTAAVKPYYGDDDIGF